MSALEVVIGEPIETALAQFGNTLDQARPREKVQPHVQIGARSMAKFSALLTPKRWELVMALKAAGPMTIYALAQHLERHYRNVHKDVSAMMEWTVIEKDAEGRVWVPWDEIRVRLPLKGANQ